MRIANVRGRLTLLTDQGGVDVETASQGRFAADRQAVRLAIVGRPTRAGPAV